MGNKNSPPAKRNAALAHKYMPSYKDTAGVTADRALRFGRSEAGKHGAVLGVHLDDCPNGSMVVCSENTIELFNPVSGDRRLRKTPFGDGVITCVDFREDSCFGEPVLVYGTRRGFIYFLGLNELNLVKALEVDVLFSATNNQNNNSNENDTVESNLGDNEIGSGGLQMKAMVPNTSGDDGSSGSMMAEDRPKNDTMRKRKKFKCGWQQQASGKGISSVNFISSTNVLVGGDDGRVHEFGLDYGGTTHLYRPPLDGAFDVSPVISAEPIGESNLIVGHENGDIHVYARYNQDSKSALSIRNGKWQQKLPSLAIESTDIIINFGRLEGFCTFSSDSHLCRVYMLNTRAAKVYDFEVMMTKLKLPNAYVTCGWYDDERQILFTGHSDGTFLLRDVKIGSNAGGMIQMRTTKVGKAAHKMQKIPTAPRGRRDVDQVLPTCITSLRYNSQNDQLLTGDYQGISRVKLCATGKESLHARTVRGSSLQQSSISNFKTDNKSPQYNVNSSNNDGKAALKSEMKSKSIVQQGSPLSVDKNGMDTEEVIDTEKEAERIIAEMNAANLLNETTTVVDNDDSTNDKNKQVEEDLLEKSKTEEEAERIIREMGMMK